MYPSAVRMSPDPMASCPPATLEISTTEGFTAAATVSTFCWRLVVLDERVILGADEAPITMVRVDAALPFAMPTPAPTPSMTSNRATSKAATQRRRRGQRNRDVGGRSLPAGGAGAKPSSPVIHSRAGWLSTVPGAL